MKTSQLILSLSLAFSPLTTHAESPQCAGVLLLENQSEREQFDEVRRVLYHDITKDNTFPFAFFKNFKNAFRDPGFYQIFESRPDLVKSLFKKWYPTDRRDLDQVLRRTGPYVFPLILDPGIRYRMNHFLDFLDRLPQGIDRKAWSIRDHYSEALGYRVIYRGMRLTKEQLEAGKVSGFAPLLSYSPEKYTESSIADFNIFFQRGPDHDALSRVDGFTRTFSQSFTGIRGLAEGFAINEKARFANSDKLAILVTAEVPVLDLIEFRMLSTVGPFDYHAWKLSGFKANGKTFWGGSKGLEYFVFGPLNPRWIMDASEVRSGEGLGPIKFLGISFD